MRLLLDTHTLVWWDGEPARLSSAALAAVTAANSQVFFSSASIWELAIKLNLKKLALARPLDELVEVQSRNGLAELFVGEVKFEALLSRLVGGIR
jgi:PIN domain nuclease of toxin-antitoxin system